MDQFIRLKAIYGLRFGFYRSGRTASQPLALREAARMVPNHDCAEPITQVLAYGTCASAKLPAIRPARGCTHIAQNQINVD